jgi:subtilisin family serine protease
LKLLAFVFLLSSSALANQWVYNSLNGKKIPQLWPMAKFDNIVAVIDTGVDINHVDLKENLWINEAEKNGLPGVDDDNNGFIDDIHGFNFVDKTNNLQDTHGHGTHVAGIIAATHNDIGIKGVNPKAKIMALKSFSSKSGDVSTSIEAIYYAVDNGAQVINCSWIERKLTPELQAAVDYAKSKGVIIVGAAGNEGMDITRRRRYLAEFDYVITVANIERNGLLADRSNYSKKKVDIAAPGQHILSTVPGDLYKKKSGTSMAAPFVSGAISLLLSIDPEFETSLIKERLMRTGKKSPRYWSKIKSKKRIDVFNFIKSN